MIQVVERVLDGCGIAPVVLGRDEDEGTVARDFGGPGTGVGMGVMRCWVGGGEAGGDAGFVEERQRVRGEVEGREA